MSDNSWGSWWEEKSKQAKLLASQAQEAASEVTKKYELDKHASSIISGISEISAAATETLKEAQKEVAKKEKKPVDVESLDFTYITENIVAMAFPFDPAKKKMKGGNDINLVSQYMAEKHGGKFMIWNISEDTYDYSKFDDQVLEYKFPGHPAPPLGLMFKMCTSVESWTDADPRNVAVIHCLTGKGRTAVIIACVLTWMGEFSSPMEALQYTANRRSVPVESLTIPSQRRYIQYFSNVLDGVKPRAEPLLLRRIIMNGTPGYCADPTWKDAGDGDITEDGAQRPTTLGCCPYIQLFKNGRLIASALATAPSNPTRDKDDDIKSATIKPKEEVRWVSQDEGCISFQLDSLVQGDLLIRCRHFDDSSGARVSMFRAAFHTGYVPSGVLRLTRAQLDGPNTDERYGEDFFIDLIFAPVEASKDAYSASEAVAGGSEGKTGGSTDSGLVLDAQSTDKFEQMLHRDGRFWENIADRKVRSKKRKSRKFMSNSTEKFSIFDGADFAKEQSRDEELKRFVDSSELNYEEEDGDAGDDEDEQGCSEVNFYKEEENSYGDGGMSDQDLINQLAQAEFDEEEDDSSGQQEQEAYVKVTAATAEQMALSELEKELGLDFNVISASSCSDSEGGKGGASSKQSPQVEEDEETSQSLDELEDFLQSLNT